MSKVFINRLQIFLEEMEEAAVSGIQELFFFLWSCSNCLFLFLVSVAPMSSWMNVWFHFIYECCCEWILDASACIAQAVAIHFLITTWKNYFRDSGRIFSCSICFCPLLKLILIWQQYSQWCKVTWNCELAVGALVFENN